MATQGRETGRPRNLPKAFQCRFRGCNATYQRKEHLHRHEAQHVQQQPFPCSSCGRTFGRSDTLRRHVRQFHKKVEPLNRAQRACDSCHRGKSRCEGGIPCNRCLHRQIQCSFDNRASPTEDRFRRPSQLNPPSLRHEGTQLRYLEKEKQCIDIYFDKFHPYWSFVHKGSFNIRRETPLLIQSMAAIGLWASGEEHMRSAAVELHNKLGMAIRDQKEKWDLSESDGAYGDDPWPIATFQAILLHIILCCILGNQNGLNLDLKFSLSSTDFGLLETLVRSCRNLGMFHYSNILATCEGPGPRSFVWVCIEEIKRFNLALYKVYGNLSVSTTDRNRNREALLTADELQFPLPNNTPLWNATGKGEWLAVIKEERFICIDEICQEKWISKSSELLEFLQL